MQTFFDEKTLIDKKVLWPFTNTFPFLSNCDTITDYFVVIFLSWENVKKDSLSVSLQPFITVNFVETHVII